MWGSNIYSNPEHFGLTVVAAADFGTAYKFDSSVVWRNEDGEFLWAADAGCSCPQPFASHNLATLTRVTSLQHLKELMTHAHSATRNGIGDHPELVRMLERVAAAGL